MTDKKNLRKKKAIWTDEEKQLWYTLIKKHGKDYNAISEQIKTKTPKQCYTRGTSLLTFHRLGEMDLDS